MSNITSAIRNRVRAWPRATVVFLGCLTVACLAAVAWFVFGERTSAAVKEMPNAARIEQVEGQVGLNRSNDNSANPQWVEASVNTPISVGDRVLTREQSQTQIAFTGRNFATLQADTSMDVLDLSDEKTQIALRTGSALFDVGSLDNDELFEVATPCGAVDLQEPGIYQVAINDQGEAVATALSGQAQVVGQGGTGKIHRGDVMRVSCASGSAASLTSVDKGQAGEVLDAYYRHRYPRVYDGRYRDYDAYLADPYFYDPDRRDVSYQYVSQYVPGVEDLDDYGNWEVVPDYGYAWTPRVDAGWAPYQDGYWDAAYPFGETWVSNEPWGYAPYHYGRWAFVTNRWFWIPVKTRPVYSPALVGFFSLGNDSVAWVPLGPGDPWVPRYYDRGWRARFFGREESRDHLFNQNVPGAISVVSAHDFNRRIEGRTLLRPDMQAFAHARPVFDPMSVGSLRRTALTPGEARRRMDVPAAMAQQINNTRVVTSTAAGSGLRRDLARTMRADPVADHVRNRQLNLRDERSTSAGLQPGRGNQRAVGNIAAQQTSGGQVPLRDTQRSRVTEARQQTPHVMVPRQPQVQAESARTQQQQRVLRQPRIDMSRVGRNVTPQPERHVQHQSRVYQPETQQRVVRQPPPARVQTRPQAPVTMRQQRPPQVQQQRLPPVQVKTPQPQQHIERAQTPVQVQRQPHPPRVAATPQPPQNPAASKQNGGRKHHP